MWRRGACGIAANERGTANSAMCSTAVAVRVSRAQSSNRTATRADAALLVRACCTKLVVRIDDRGRVGFSVGTAAAEGRELRARSGLPRGEAAQSPRGWKARRTGRMWFRMKTRKLLLDGERNRLGVDELHPITDRKPGDEASAFVALGAHAVQLSRRPSEHDDVVLGVDALDSHRHLNTRSDSDARLTALFGHEITAMSKATFYFVIAVLLVTEIVQAATRERG